jgi:hypothetical protein
MMSPVEPFLSADLAYRREQLMADVARSRAASTATSGAGVRRRSRLVPRVVRRAIAGS